MHSRLRIGPQRPVIDPDPTAPAIDTMSGFRENPASKPPEPLGAKCPIFRPARSSDFDKDAGQWRISGRAGTGTRTGTLRVQAGIASTNHKPLTCTNVDLGARSTQLWGEFGPRAERKGLHHASTSTARLVSGVLPVVVRTGHSAVMYAAEGEGRPTDGSDAVSESGVDSEYGVGADVSGMVFRSDLERWDAWASEVDFRSVNVVVLAIVLGVPLRTCFRSWFGWGWSARACVLVVGPGGGA
jgi:hypothetical protein